MTEQLMPMDSNRLADARLVREALPGDGMAITVNWEPGKTTFEAAGYAVQYQDGRPVRFEIDFGPCRTRERREAFQKIMQGGQWYMTLRAPGGGDITAQFLASWGPCGHLTATMMTAPVVYGKTLTLRGLVRHLWGPAPLRTLL